MAREKKDGQFVNVYLRRDLNELLDNYCKDSGVTKTFVIEKGIQMYLSDKEINKKNDGQ